MAAPVLGTARNWFVPPKGATVDRTHSLASGLEICFVPAYGLVELARGYTVTKGGTPSAGSSNRFGPSGRITASTSDYWEIAAPDAPFLGALTVQFTHRNLSASALRANISKGSGSATNSPFEIYLTSQVSPQQIEVWRRSATTSVQWSRPNAIVVNSDNHVLIAMPRTSGTGSPCLFWLNGNYSESASATSITATGYGGPLRIGRRADGAVQSDGDYGIVSIWSRQITQDEAAQLYANPFCFLRY